MTTQNQAEIHEKLHFIKPKAKLNESDIEKWPKKEIKSLFQLPFNDLVYQAHVTHRANFNPNEVQLSTLLSIKTGVVLKIVDIVHNQPDLTQKLRMSH